MSKFRRFGARAQKFFRDNFVMLAIILAVLWLLVVWVRHVWLGMKVEELAAYAMFGTAMATLLLGIGTALMAHETKVSRKLTETQIEENRRLAQAPRIRELIIYTINPLLESVKQIKGWHERREYAWVTPDLEIAKELLGDDQDVAVFQRGDFERGYTDAFFPHPAIKAEQHVSGFQALYVDFGRKHPSLTKMIQEYDKKAEDFRVLLVDLAKTILPQESEEPGRYGEIYQRYTEGWGLINGFQMHALALSVACLTFNSLLGASEKFSYEQVRNERHRDLWSDHKDFFIDKIISGSVKGKAKHIAKDADDLAGELRGIEAQLSKIKDRYRDEYRLTHKETEMQETEPGVLY